MKKKYIVFSDSSAKIFDCDKIHYYMTGGKDVMSAGFVTLDENNLPIEVFGESTTLGVKSCNEDLIILQSITNN